MVQPLRERLEKLHAPSTDPAQILHWTSESQAEDLVIKTNVFVTRHAKAVCKRCDKSVFVLAKTFIKSQHQFKQNYVLLNDQITRCPKSVFQDMLNDREV